MQQHDMSIYKLPVLPLCFILQHTSLFLHCKNDVKKQNKLTTKRCRANEERMLQTSDKEKETDKKYVMDERKHKILKCKNLQELTVFLPALSTLGQHCWRVSYGILQWGH